MPRTTSRRRLLAGLAAVTTGATAGCFGDESPTARCSSEGVTSDNGHLRDVNPIRGDEMVSLGILVSEEAPSNDDVAAVVVRNRDGDIVADVPIRDNRDMSDLEVDGSFGSKGGELYAVPLGPPPQHAVLRAESVGSDGNVTDSMTVQFNCYRSDGKLP